MNRESQGVAQAKVPAGARSEARADAAAPARGGRAKTARPARVKPAPAPLPETAEVQEPESKISAPDPAGVPPSPESQEAPDAPARASTRETPPGETPEKENTDEAASGRDGGSDANRRFSIDALSDVPLPASLRLGERSMPLSRVLEFGAGSPVTLDPPSGQTVELVIADLVVARGRLVILEGAYGIEVTEILAEGDRLAMLPGLGR